MSESILIVDDEINECRRIERILAQRGLHCYRSMGAQDAIELMKRIRFHMAFLDTSIPEMQKLDFVRKLKDINPKMSIVLVSDDDKSAPECTDYALDESLFNACIYKPFLSKAVLDAVDTCW